MIYLYSLLYFVYHLYFGFMSSTQINFRIPADLKNNAMKKAQEMGYNLNGIVKIFLYKFVDEDDIVTIRSDIRLEKIFDRGLSTAFTGKKSRRRTKEIGKLLGA